MTLDGTAGECRQVICFMDHLMRMLCFDEGISRRGLVNGNACLHDMCIYLLLI